MTSQSAKVAKAVRERWYAANELIREGDRVRVLSQLSTDLPRRTWVGLTEAGIRFGRATMSLERVTKKAAQ